MKRKTAKKKPGRKPAKKLKVVMLSFANIGRRTKETAMTGIKVTQHGMYFGPDTSKVLGIKHKDYLLVAPDKSGTYIAKKPKNVFGGHHVTVAKSGRVAVNNVAKQLKLKPGHYNLGEIPVSVPITNEQGHEVFVNAYRLD